jgi:hypothetical protein
MTWGDALRFDHDEEVGVVFTCIFYGYTGLYHVEAEVLEAL